MRRLGDGNAHWRALLECVPGAAMLTFDHDLRVHLAEGGEFERLGIDTATMLGRPLPEVLPASSWAELRGPYEGALAGTATTFEFRSGEITYSIRVAPLRDPDGEIEGALAISHEVTGERRLEATVETQRVAHRDAQRLFEMSPDMLATASLDGQLTWVNPSWERCLGYSPEELMSRPYIELIHPEDVESTLAAAGRLAEGPATVVDFENRYRAKNGEWRWLRWTSRSDGTQIYAAAKDVTDRRQAIQDRRASERQMSAIIENTRAAISVRDADLRYQLANRAFEDTFGLQADWILGRRDDDLLSPAAAEAAHEHDRHVLTSGETVECEETIFVDGADRTLLTVRFPLRDSDGEIYAVCGTSEDITQRRRAELELSERLRWTSTLHAAVLDDRLVLHAQPILNLATNQVEQDELLIRMRSETGPGLISPGEFLPAAERFDLIGLIDQWVLERAVELASQGRRVEVNLSARSISDPALVAEIERLVKAHAGVAENLVFEITETAVADNIDAARDFAERLRDLGASIALDDFGVGYGTFTYLRHLPVDYLKIDMMFVRDLLDDEADRQVVQAIIGVARDLGISTIAEGVEDQATLDLLSFMGVDYAQGYWIGRPAPIDAATDGELSSV